MLDTTLEIIRQWGPVVGILIVGILAGFFLKRVIRNRLIRLAEKTKWRGDDIVFQSLESHIVLWTSLVAFFRCKR